MNHPLVVRPLAQADIERAFRWYEQQSPGLGTEFIRALDSALAMIERQPDLFPETHRDTRRALLRRFP